MKKFILLIGICLVIISCKRRPLSYDYDPTLEVILNVNWSEMSEVPTGMSVYCYLEGGTKPIVKIKNINTIESSIKLKLGAGKYNVLVFNQIPSDFGTIQFDEMNSFETAEINAVKTTSKWAESKAESDLIRDPEELAAATYLDFEITEEEIDKKLDAYYSDKRDDDKDETIVIQKVINLTPKVVIKTTRVKVRLSGVHNLRSTRATLYGMASGYSFSKQKSHSNRATHLLEGWRLTQFDDYREGEVTAFYTCFGMPEQTSESLTDDYSDWDGVMDVDYLLVDNKTVVSKSYDLTGHVRLAEDDSRVEDEEDEDVNREADIYIDLDYGDEGGDGDDPEVLPDVKPAGGSNSGFDATVEDWGPEEDVDVPM